MRHGVAKHNVRDPITGRMPDISSPSLFDPELIEYGVHQSKSVGKRLRDGPDVNILDTVQLIVSSPLTRCLQTAQHVFQKEMQSGADCSSFPSSFSHNPSTTTTTISVEVIREAYGIHYTDKRRNKSVLQKRFPTVQFDMTETDERWKKDRRETARDIVFRVQDFVERWIPELTEKTIFVVTHGVWLEYCFRTYASSMMELANKRIFNCEVYATEIVSSIDHSGCCNFVRMQNIRQIL